ncbi:hypothetical protein YC2023_018421 [Brassica napus]
MHESFHSQTQISSNSSSSHMLMLEALYLQVACRELVSESDKNNSLTFRSSLLFCKAP